MISFPVPVSPNSSTGAPLRDTILARAMTAARPVSLPISRSSGTRGLPVRRCSGTGRGFSACLCFCDIIWIDSVLFDSFSELYHGLRQSPGYWLTFDRFPVVRAVHSITRMTDRPSRAEARGRSARGAMATALPLLVVLAAAVPAAAQQPADDRPVLAAGQDGFALQSATGDYRLQIGLLVHADGRFAVDDSDELIADTFAIRRARPYL